MKLAQDDYDVKMHMRRPLERVALWQFICFVLLICFVWAAVTIDLKHVVFGTPRSPPDFFNASLFTAGILATGIITVGQTFMQQKRMLRGLIIVCSYCHKVQLEKSAWQQMEIYVANRTLAQFSHGVCPTCFDKAIHDLEHAGGTKSGVKKS